MYIAQIPESDSKAIFWFLKYPTQNQKHKIKNYSYLHYILLTKVADCSFQHHLKEGDEQMN